MYLSHSKSNLIYMYSVVLICSASNSSGYVFQKSIQDLVVKSSYLNELCSVVIDM